MSDNSQVVIRLDVPGDEEREAIVASVRTWLLSTEVIAPFAPKPTWREDLGSDSGAARADGRVRAAVGPVLLRDGSTLPPPDDQPVS